MVLAGVDTVKVEGDLRIVDGRSGEDLTEHYELSHLELLRRGTRTLIVLFEFDEIEEEE